METSNDLIPKKVPPKQEEPSYKKDNFTFDYTLKLNDSGFSSLCSHETSNRFQSILLEIIVDRSQVDYTK